MRRYKGKTFGGIVRRSVVEMSAAGFPEIFTGDRYFVIYPHYEYSELVAARLYDSVGCAAVFERDDMSDSAIVRFEALIDERNAMELALEE